MQAYLDHNARAPLRPEAAQAAMRAGDMWGNPSSPHEAGRRARAVIEEARETLAATAGAQPGGVVFASGATEANHLAFRLCPPGADVIVSAIEHVSLLAAAEGQGRRVNKIPPGPGGLIRPEAVAEALAHCAGPAFVSIMLANNETGVIQPVAEIAGIVKQAGGVMHCDAAQAAGKIPVDMETLGVDALSLSGHKLGGPPGAGALIVREGLPFAPLLTGGGQEQGRRAGTENLPGIAGMAAAAQAAHKALDAFAELAEARNRMEAQLMRLRPDAHIFGREAPRLPNTSCFAIPGLPAETALILFDLDGICLSAGSACSSGKVAASHVLDAMGAAPGLARAALRASLGWNTQSADLACFAEALARHAAAPEERAA